MSANRLIDIVNREEYGPLSLSDYDPAQIDALSPAAYVTGRETVAVWQAKVSSGEKPTLYPVAAHGELTRLEIGPGRVWLLGGAPGAGKTAFTMQLLFDALRMTPSLRALVCNVEMAPQVLLDRQLARLSGVNLNMIRNRTFEQLHEDRIAQAMETIESVADRLTFLIPPYSLNNVAMTADQTESTLIVIDYIQRIASPGDNYRDQRGALNASMDYLRRFADAGRAVIVVSALGRTRDAHGRSSYAGEGLNLASFRESSELEYGADDAFILHPASDNHSDDAIQLLHLKSRYGERADRALHFNRSIQRFSPAGNSKASTCARK